MERSERRETSEYGRRNGVKTILAKISWMKESEMEKGEMRGKRREPLERG